MTLNIQLASRHAMYLTGDFRITFPDKRYEDDFNVQKLVPVAKSQWCGLISYSGLAATPRRLETGSWIAEQVRPTATQEGLDPLVRRLALAEGWVKRFSVEDRRLAIIVCGYQQRKPFRRVISNHIDGDGKLIAGPPGKLQVYEDAPREAEIKTFGSGNVTAEDRELLLQLLRENANDQLLEALARANARAALNSNQTVSLQCVVGQMLPTGDGELSFHLGDRGEGYMPDWVKRYMQDMGMSLPREKSYPDGVRRPVSLEAATTRMDPGKQDSPAMSMFVFRNADPPEQLAPIKGAGKVKAYFKIAGANEPSRVQMGISSIRVPGKQHSESERHNSAGGEHFRATRYEDAEREFRQAVKLDERNAHAQGNLALVLGLTNRWAEATEHYERAIALAPQLAVVAKNFALQTYTHEGSLAARARVSNLLRVQPESGLLQIVLGDIFNRDGNIVRALAHYRKAREMKTPSDEVEPALALALDKSGAPLEECIAAYKTALSLINDRNTNVGHLKYRLAVLLLLTGRFAEARKQLREASEAGITIGNARVPTKERGLRLMLKSSKAALKRLWLGRMT